MGKPVVQATGNIKSPWTKPPQDRIPLLKDTGSTNPPDEIKLLSYFSPFVDQSSQACTAVIDDILFQSRDICNKVANSRS